MARTIGGIGSLVSRVCETAGRQCRFALTNILELARAGENLTVLPTDGIENLKFETNRRPS